MSVTDKLDRAVTALAERFMQSQNRNWLSVSTQTAFPTLCEPFRQCWLAKG